MKTSLIQLFDFFLPRFCSGCNKKLSAKEEPVCSECLKSILIADKYLLKSEFDRKFGQTKIIGDFYSAYIFETADRFQSKTPQEFQKGSDLLVLAHRV